jgi:hypothetical protein
MKIDWSRYPLCYRLLQFLLRLGSFVLAWAIIWLAFTRLAISSNDIGGALISGVFGVVIIMLLFSWLIIDVIFASFNASMHTLWRVFCWFTIINLPLSYGWIWLALTHTK